MDDISTEELSDISQDNTDSQKDLLSPSKRKGEIIAQIADLEEKLELLEQETLPELLKKWKKIDSKAAADKRTLLGYKEYLRDSAVAESRQDLNEADAELESKREEFRSQLIQEYDEKQRLMLEEKAQMDSCPNWIEMYENKNKRRLRPRDAKDDKPDDPLSISIQNSGLKWLRKKAKLYYPELDPKRKRVGHSLTLLTESEILLTESEIAEDLKMIKTSRKRRDNTAGAQKVI